MQPVPIAITGLGLCTPLGADVPTTWRRLLAGDAIRDHSRVAGDFALPRVCSLAEKALREAISDANWSIAQDAAAPLVVGTSKGPIEAWLSSPQSPVLSPQSLTLGLADVAAHLANTFALSIGPRLTISTACASGLHALIRGAMLIREGHPRVMVVGCESSLHPLFLGSFKRLGVLAPAGYGCRPFDENRKGFLVSEAAAAVCMESHGQGVHIESFAMGGDGMHLTGADPSGATLRRVLAKVIDQRGVDLVHGHGTATEMNDPIELAAIENTLSSDAVLYSHKGAIGHTLGAAGMIATVLNCLSHRHGIVPPNVNTTSPLEMKRLMCSARAVDLRINRSVALASGFGGGIAAVSLINA